MKICLTVTSDYGRLYGHDLSKIIDVAKMADAAGIYQLDFAEHLLMGDGKGYPNGKYPLPLDEPWPEPMLALAAVAAVTNKIRLTTGILIAALRPPALLAKQLATLDSLSKGRVDIGIGVGWQQQEFDACGIPFEGRGQRLDDTMRACKALWSGKYCSFASPTFNFSDVIAVPPPVQKEMPIWWAGPVTQKTADRIAEMGIGWIPLFLPDDKLKEGIDLIRATMKKYGRDPNTLLVRHQIQGAFGANGKLDLDKTFTKADYYHSIGVTVFGIGVGWSVASVEHVPELIAGLGNYSK
ncbi:MAG TPA: TIGR03619 family F420-dependent LLM class oxidoreductase [Spongiibacteraceae bacterium]